MRRPKFVQKDFSCLLLVTKIMIQQSFQDSVVPNRQQEMGEVGD